MPNNKQLSQELVNQAETTNDLPEKLKLLNDAIAKDPNNRDAIKIKAIVHCQLSQYDPALLEFNQLIKKNSEQNSWAYTQSASIAFSCNQLDTSLQFANKAIEANPHNPNAYYMRGVVYNNLNQPKDALDNFNKTIEFNPKDANAFLERGITHILYKQAQNALADFERAIALGNKTSRAFANRGVAQVELNNLDAASKDFSEAIKIDANNHHAYLERGILKLKLFKQNKNTAELDNIANDFREVVKLKPEDGSGYTYLAKTLLKQKKYDEALTNIDTGIRLSSKSMSAIAYICYGRILLKQNDFDNALEAFNKALEYNPNNLSAQKNRVNTSALIAGLKLSYLKPSKEMPDEEDGVECIPAEEVIQVTSVNARC